jgi:hypothetical protein
VSSYIFITLKKVVKLIKPIQDFENYLATYDGRIFSVKANKYLSLWIDNVGYYQCLLYKNGKKYHKRVHKLVFEAYNGKIYDKMQINHKDGNKLNNSITNLELATNAENTQHGYDNNLYHSYKRCIKVKVFDANGNFIETFKSIRETADKLNINRKTLSAILFNNKTNNYNYIFELDENIEDVSTIETTIVCQQLEGSRVALG